MSWRDAPVIQPVQKNAPQGGGWRSAPIADGATPRRPSLPPAEPPSGVMIHGAQRSEIAGRPDMAVDRTGMDLQEQQRAARALNLRAGSPEASRLAPFAQGIGLSGTDELVSGAFAGVQALRGRDPGEEYRFAQEVQRQDLERERTERPVSAVAGQIAGNLALAPLAMGAAPAMQGSLFRQGLTGAGIGAGVGAVDGYLAAQEGERTDSARTGATFGAAAGAATPFAMAGLRNVGQRMLDSATTNRALQRMGLSRPAGDTIHRTLQADDALTPTGRGTEAIRQAGPDAMLADAGQATRGQLDTAIQRSGEAGTGAMRAVQQRTGSALQRLTTQLDDALGSPQGLREAQRGVRQGSATARRTAYDAAYARPVDYASDNGRRIEGLLGRVDRNVIDRANRLMRLEGQESAQILADVAEDGSVSFTRMPDVRQLDYIKRGLGDLADSANATRGLMGGDTQEGAALKGLARELRDAVAESVPEYRTALSTAADTIEQTRAMSFGYDLLRPQTTRDVVRMQVDDMTAPQLQAARAGVRSYIDDLVSNVRTSASNIDSEGLPQLRKQVMDLNTPAAREKLRAIMPDDAQYEALTRELDQAGRALVLQAETATNSRTFGRQAGAEAIERAMEYGPAGAMQRGEPLNSGQRLIQALFSTRPQDDLARQDRVFSEIADFLTRQPGGQQAQITGDLSAAYRQQMANELLGRRIGASGGALTGIGAYQGAQQSPLMR